jgi:hypothetical protein
MAQITMIDMLGVHDGDRHDCERVTRREAQMGIQDVRQGRIRYINMLDKDDSGTSTCWTMTSQMDDAVRQRTSQVSCRIIKTLARYIPHKILC